MKSFFKQVGILFLLIIFFGNQVFAQNEKVVVWSKIENGYQVQLIKENDFEYILRTPIDLLEETNNQLYEPSNQVLIPEIQTNELIQARLASSSSTISLQFNQSVRTEVDRLLKNRQFMEKMLGRANYFLPMADSIAREKQVPSVLKYLPLVESGYKVKSKSRAGAKGIWQFIPSTAKMYGLKVNRTVDERLNPELATDAALDYLVDLNEIFGDWKLALAGYNAGPGRVRRAIRQSGKENPTFWDIQHLLPRETQRYIVKFIAAVYVMEHYNQIGLQPSIDGYEEAKEHVDALRTTKFASVSVTNGEIPPNSVVLKYEIKSGDNLGFIAEWYDVKTKDIRAWNGITGNLIRAGQTLSIYVPADQKHVYEEINSLTFDQKENSAENATQEKQLLASTSRQRVYKIRAGDTLWDISKRSGVSVNQIKQLNDISDSRKLKPGMVLQLGD